MNNERKITGVILIVIIIIGAFLYFNSQKGARVAQAISNFVECQGYGYPVSGSSPRVCQAPNGQIFPETFSGAAYYPQTAAVYNAYQAPAQYQQQPVVYNTYPSTYSNSRTYANTGAAGYMTFPIARSTAYSYYSGPTTYYNTSSYTGPNPSQVNPLSQYPNGNGQNCFYQQDGSYTCQYQY